MKQCIVEGCVNEREKNRRLCLTHYRERHRMLAKQRYLKQGRYSYTVTCEICGKQTKAFRRDQRFCGDCYKKALKHTKYKENQYECAHGKGHCFMHRKVAEEVLGYKLGTDDVVHHVDLDVMNNDVTNLMVLARADHIRLHMYLKLQGAILSKGNIENFEKCWKHLIVPMTTTWLETAGVKVIKLWEIGQSAAEPPQKEEGSETMHEAAKHSDMQADDIVQTTTANAGMREHVW